MRAMVFDLQMDQTILYGGFVLTLFLIAILAFVREFRGKYATVTVAFILLSAGLAAAYMDLLSRPKPVVLMMEWQKPDVEKAEVLGIKMVPNRAIYVLLDWDGLNYPRYFKYPWDEQMAEQMQQAMEGSRSEGNGDEVMMSKPFEKSLDRRQHPWVYEEPQRKMMPPKADSRSPEILEYHHPGRDA